jgi:hypothetical protein
MIKQLPYIKLFARCSMKLRLSLQSCKQMSRCPEHILLRPKSFITASCKPQRHFFCTSQAAFKSNSEKSLSHPQEKQLELKKKKEAKRLERLGKQRIRQEAVSYRCQVSLIYKWIKKRQVSKCSYV